MLSLGYVSLCWYRKTTGRERVILYTHPKPLHTCVTCMTLTRKRSSESGCSWKWLFRVFLRNPIRVCEVSNSFFSLKKLWEDLNLLRHHQSFHFSFAVTLQTLACHSLPRCLPLLWMPLALFLRLFCSKLDSWNIGVRQSIRQVVCPPSALLIRGGVWKYKSLLQKRAALVQVTQNCTAPFVKFKERISWNVYGISPYVFSSMILK